MRSSFTMLQSRAIAITFAAALVILMPATGAMGTTISGTITINATIAVGKDVPANAVMTATGDVGERGNTGNHGASRSTTVTFTPGKTAHATFVLPYTWTVTKGALVSVALTVSTNDQTVPYAALTRAIPLPSNGATTTVEMDAAI